MTHFRGFDGLRAIAILFVILWHTGGGIAALPGPVYFVVRSGWVGVDLFFALSGFLITALLLRDENASADGRFSVSAFYLRRALRILPVFYFVLALNALVLAPIPFFHSVASGEPFASRSSFGLMPYATLWSNYFIEYYRGPKMNPGAAYLVTWSLCIEEHFYLLWPFALTLVRTWRRRLILSVGVCVATLALRVVVVSLALDRAHALEFASHYRLDSILWGAVAALLYQRASVATPLRRGALGGALAAILVLVAVGVLSRLPPPPPLAAAIGPTVLAVAAALLVLEIASAPTSLPAQILEAAPLRSIGKVSYGMYLIHFQMMDVANLVLGPLGTKPPPAMTRFLIHFAFNCLLTFSAAWVMYQIVERPFLKLKDRFGRGPRRQPLPIA